MMVAAMATLMGCQKANEESTLPAKADYNGTTTFTVRGQESSVENIKVNFDAAEDGKTASITIFKISFAPKMPQVNITIPNVQLTHNGSETLLECDNVVPISLGGEEPNFTVHELKGTRKGNELEFSLKFGSTPTSYKGVMNVETEEEQK